MIDGTANSKLKIKTPIPARIPIAIKENPNFFGKEIPGVSKKYAVPHAEPKVTA